MIPGTEITLGDKQYTVAPMNFSTLIKVAPMLKSFAALGNKIAPSEDDFRNMVTVLLLAIQRNHPETTFDEIAEALDMNNIGTIMVKVMGASGTVTKGEEAAVSH